MKQIWKFPLDRGSRITIEMPKRAEILSVQIQFDQPTIWALVNPAVESEERNFIVVNTGEPFDATSKNYIGTFQRDRGLFVSHVFEIIESK